MSCDGGSTLGRGSGGSRGLSTKWSSWAPVEGLVAETVEAWAERVDGESRGAGPGGSGLSAHHGALDAQDHQIIR